MTPEDIRAWVGERLVICSVSGGKDSAATSLYLSELGIEHWRVFADTGWEARETYEYLRGPLAEKLGHFFQQSHGTFIPIDQVVRWARTKRGGKVENTQEELFAHGWDGCARWGVCGS